MVKRNFQTLPIETEPEPQIGRHRRSCGGCKTLTCHSIHGPVAPNCPITGCYFCADLATIDDEISDAYDCLLKLVKRRAQIVTKTHHEPYIHRLPVELLSLIFIFVKKAHDDCVRKRTFSLPGYSPPLRVGSVCKKWKDIALGTPQLWTDIFVDTMKPISAQIKMINELARRSGGLPLNVSIFLEDDSPDNEQAVLKEWNGVAKALRSSAIRWNTVAIQGPWSIFHKLLDELEDTSSITSFHAFLSSGFVNPIKLQHPLRPKYFYSWNTSGEHIPIEWDNLVHLDLGSISPRELLHIIHSAQKLRHFAVVHEWFGESELYPMPTNPVINHSLIHFKTMDDVLDYLTLPSLRYFDCMPIESTDNIECLDSVINFINRSQAPLQTFLFDCVIDRMDLALSLEKLPLITSLTVLSEDHIDHILQVLTKPYPPVILPHLRQLAVMTYAMGSSTWSLFSRLFRNDTQLDTPGLECMKDSATLGRSLSKVSVRIRHDDAGMDKTTLLHLLAVRKSGVEIDCVAGVYRDDVFPALANLYNVKL